MKKTRFGWLELIIGVAMILLGLHTIIRPGSLMNGLVIIYAVMAVISGSRDIVFCCRAEKNYGILPGIALAAGVVSIMTGVMLFLYPTAGSMIISMLIPLWFITHSIFQLAGSCILLDLTDRFHHHLSVATGVIGLIIGFVLLFHPTLTVTLAGWLIGCYLVITGINSIAIAFSKTGFHERW